MTTPVVETGPDRNDRPYRNDRPQRDDRRRDDRGQGGDRRSHTSQRGGSEREYNPYAPVRERVPEPQLPDDITPRDLHPAARNELKTLSMENAERVARHLAMTARLIDEDPQLAHEHALAASRRAGRIPVVRESVAITAYAIGDFALALRELRTYRRISGREDQIALIVDSERGVGRPDRALEEGRGVDRTALPTEVRVALAIAMSGARLDRGELELALGELEIPELDPDRAFEWSPALFAARAAVLEDLGRTDEAEFWAERAEAAADALGAASAEHDEVIVEDGLIEDFDDDEYDEDVAGESDDAVTDVDDADGAREEATGEPADAGTEVDDADAEPDAEPAVSAAPDVPAASAGKSDDVAAEVAEILMEAGVDEAPDAPSVERADDEGKA
ncbi:hypothetical protein L2X99_03155 [Microbacterium sp. KUDC0406]|uniref:hypothetical protein n=1 Tax=Microbacterium sp. KUDC0406 TaxID=2909588 RepID=UPI001F2C0045|nr:hypothetical protein [Microbacterium sp. KUDC0406]UJP10677.1 hypothetical protein L2X99_03155 [Microbacterium sp. KUDC0406]